uniref:FAS1 domain-containing protein n=1 Tax=Aegilops tauschii subsp. strangulata TaxID=200361 RepID=A0A452ZWK4_AEGTS
MASSRRALILLAVVLAAVPAALSQKTTAPAPEAAPETPEAPAAGTTPKASAAPNVTAVLEKAGQYTKFIRLMASTQQDTQLNAQANDSDTGFTVFAPTDSAFNSLKPGTLNSLSQQDQVTLVQAHIVPTFYSMESFETASNPVRTQASGTDGPCTVNVTATSNSAVNVSTGIVHTTVGAALRATRPLAVYSVDKIKPSGNNVNVSTGVKGNNMLLGSVVSKDFPLAVYSVDKMPLPYELFGPQPPTPAPAPAPAPTKSKPKKKKKSAGIAEAPEADDATADDDTEKSAAASLSGVARWAAVLGAAVVGAMF